MRGAIHPYVIIPTPPVKGIPLPLALLHRLLRYCDDGPAPAGPIANGVPVPPPLGIGMSILQKFYQWPPATGPSQTACPYPLHWG